MSGRRHEQLTKLGFDVVTTMPGTGGHEAGEGAPYREAETPVLAHYAPATARERWRVLLNGPTTRSLHATEAALSADHLYVRLSAAPEVTRIPRGAVQTRWQEGSAVCYGLADDSCLAFPARSNDQLLTSLDHDLSERPDAPFRSMNTAYGGPRTLLTSLAIGIGAGMASGHGVLVHSAVMGAASVVTMWFAANRVVVTTEGLTLRTGTYPSWSRFVPRASIHSVVIRARGTKNARATIEVEVRDKKNVPRHYVVARTTGAGPARDLGERELATDARRIATLLDVLGPRWV